MDANQQTRDGGAMNKFRLAALMVVGALSLGVLLVLILSVSGPPDAAQARAVDPSPASSAGQSAAITPAASSGGPTLDSGEPETGVVLPAGETATPNASAAGDGNQFTPPEKTALKYPNLGSMLNQMVARVEAEEASAEDAAGDAPVHQAESVAVTIHLSGNVDGVVSFLEDHGGPPRNVGGDYTKPTCRCPCWGQSRNSPASSGCGQSSRRSRAAAARQPSANPLRDALPRPGTPHRHIKPHKFRGFGG